MHAVAATVGTDTSEAAAYPLPPPPDVTPLTQEIREVCASA